MKTPKNAVNAEIKTVNSNMIGKKGGTVKKFTGLPCTINGKRKDDGMNSSKTAVIKPRKPPQKMMYPKGDFPFLRPQRGSLRSQIPR
jgi:hypothetical protein